jgi:acetyl esterase/lipase
VIQRTPPPCRIRRLLAPLIALALGALQGACSPLALLDHYVPTHTYTVERGIAYGDLPRQRLDIYTPAPGVTPAANAKAAAPLPVVVFFYGGNWASGERADYRFVGEALASRGFVAVIADYRLHPEARYPDFLQDSARAVAWATRHAARFGGDPRRLYVAGHSAGAYNAAMLAYAPAYLAAADVDPAAIRGFIGLAGPYDFLPLTGDVTKAVFGFPGTPPDTQPLFHVGRTPGARLAPALLLVAPEDTVVRPGNSDRLAARLREAGGRAQQIAYPMLDHRSIVGALAAPLRGLGPVLSDIERFINSTP